MYNNYFISALALFQSLFKSKKGDVYAIIAHFIMVVVNNKSSFTTEEVIELLNKEYHLKLPVRIVNMCIQNKYFSYSKGKYHLINSYSDAIQELCKELREIDQQNDNILNNLFVFVEKDRLINLNDEEKKSLSQQFYDYILDNDSQCNTETYKESILKFIINNEHDAAFLQNLDHLKEGLIIYNGIRYYEGSKNNTWKHHTVFFLDVEYLFSSYGMNGSYYKNCIDDFLSLVKEINDGSAKKDNHSRIELRFFSETKEKIDEFFRQAILLKNNPHLSNVTEAMEFILNNCVDETEILHLKSKFYTYLDELDIKEYDGQISIEKGKDLIFEKADTFNKQFEERFSQYIDKAHYYLKFADYINILREGKKVNDIEKCMYVFLSDSSLSTEISKFIMEVDSTAGTHLLSRTDEFVERMWFKLQKGLIDQNSFASFNVLMKAKKIVSSFLSEKATKAYEEYKKSTASRDELKNFYFEIRKNCCAPESVHANALSNESVLDDYEESKRKYFENQSVLKAKADRVDLLQKEKEEYKTQYDNLRKKIDEIENEKRQISYQHLCEKRAKIKRWFCPVNWIVIHLRLFFIFSIVICIALLFKEKYSAISGGFLSALGIWKLSNSNIRGIRFFLYRKFLEIFNKK